MLTRVEVIKNALCEAVDRHAAFIEGSTGLDSVAFDVKLKKGGPPRVVLFTPRVEDGIETE